MASTVLAGCMSAQSRKHIWDLLRLQLKHAKREQTNFEAPALLGACSCQRSAKQPTAPQHSEYESLDDDVPDLTADCALDDDDEDIEILEDATFEAASQRHMAAFNENFEAFLALELAAVAADASGTCSPQLQSCASFTWLVRSALKSGGIDVQLIVPHIKVFAELCRFQHDVLTKATLNIMLTALRDQSASTSHYNTIVSSFIASDALQSSMAIQARSLVDYVTNDDCAIPLESGTPASRLILTRKCVLLMLRCTELGLSALPAASHILPPVLVSALSNLQTCFERNGLNLEEAKGKSWLMRLVRDQDDVMIDALRMITVCHTALTASPALVQQIPLLKYFMSEFNIHALFFEFCSLVAFDHLVLLDLVMSSETSFLEYLLIYARAAAANPVDLQQSLMVFAAEHGDEQVAQKFKGTITSLLETLSRLEASGVFPFPVQPLIRRLTALVEVINSLT